MKDFWHQELTNQMQSYYVTWPIRCNCYITYIFTVQDRPFTPTAIAVLSVVFFLLLLFDNLREKGQCPWLNSRQLHVFKIRAAHRLKIIDLSQLGLLLPWPQFVIHSLCARFFPCRRSNSLINASKLNQRPPYHFIILIYIQSRGLTGDTVSILFTSAASSFSICFQEWECPVVLYCIRVKWVATQNLG